MEVVALQKDLDKLKAKRVPLSASFDKHPWNIKLALEIKKIDDEISVCTGQLRAERQKRKSPL
jgi:hypothetical protein